MSKTQDNVLRERILADANEIGNIGDDRGRAMSGIDMIAKLPIMVHSCSSPPAPKRSIR